MIILNVTASVHEQISDFIPPTSICNYKDDDRLSVCVFRQNSECLQAKVDSNVYSNWFTNFKWQTCG